MGRRGTKTKADENKPAAAKTAKVAAPRSRTLWLTGLLAGLILVAYAPVRSHDFVNYDDNEYVTGNTEVKRGLTMNGLVWAFTTGDAANWHPLTWLSHMTDVQLFGMNPEAHHLTNVALHITDTILLFWVLIELTNAVWCSAVVAALFGLHPLHVESVAWVAERKDVLSTLFWMLSLWAYLGYVRRSNRARYAIALVLFAAGLMAKPMVVTLPFVLLLLDFWPLKRWDLVNWRKLPDLVREKIPFFALTILSSVITFVVQRNGRAVISLTRVPIANRFENAFWTYFLYLSRMLWPHDLSVLYPATRAVSPLWIIGAFFIVAMTIVAVWSASRRPYIAVGWFWYLGTLIPVIGFVQVGEQASADRYTYLPLIGIFLIIAFGTYDIAQLVPPLNPAIIAAAVAAVVACLWLTRVQLKYWQDSQTLWTHALSLDNENASAHVNVGSYLEKAGKLDEAILHYREAIRIEPEKAVAHSNLASALEHKGQLSEAIVQYSEALRVGPESAEWDFNLGNALAMTGSPEHVDQAIPYLQKALQQRSDFPEARNALGICYLTQNLTEKAVQEFSEAIEEKPDYAGAHNNLATALGEQGRSAQAISEYVTAVRLDPSYIDAHENLAILLAAQGDTSQAVEHFSAVLRLNPADGVARQWLTKLNSLPNDAKRN